VSDDGNAALGGLFWLAVVGTGIYVYWFGFNETWYAWQYDVATSNVKVAAKPKDCDFISAPLGAKNCHYEPTVYVLNADGATIGGTRKMKFSTSTTGRPIVSYDDGKNWDWYWGDKLPNTKAERVNVTWSKVAD
jgi:hypothetical protein